MASSVSKISFSGLQDRIVGQFRNLDTRNPVTWPTLPRYGLFILIASAIVVALWFVWLSNSDEELQAEQAKEVKLREDFKTKLAKAINLAALLKQREQVLQYVTQLEKQLPSKAEMDALLSDINQSGLGRSLKFELFRPGQVTVRDYYAELPISIKVTGRFHDMGSFASDIANLSRIVTLNDLIIVPSKDGSLAMEAKAKTFRYLDADELAEQQRAIAKTKGAKK
jgi:type IV pilus assembly protein PilO